VVPYCVHSDDFFVVSFVISLKLFFQSLSFSSRPSSIAAVCAFYCNSVFTGPLLCALYYDVCSSLVMSGC